MGCKTWRLRDHGRIDVTDLPAQVADQRCDMAQQRATVGTLVAGIGIGDVGTEVAQRQCAPQRIRDGVQQGEFYPSSA